VNEKIVIHTKTKKWWKDIVFVMLFCAITSIVTYQCTNGKRTDTAGSDAAIRYSESDRLLSDLLRRNAERSDVIEAGLIRIAESARGYAQDVRDPAYRLLEIAEIVEDMENDQRCFSDWITDNYYDWLDKEIERELGIKIP